MTSSPSSLARRLLYGALFLFFVSFLGSCVDGATPLDPTQSAPTALLSVAGDFAQGLVDEAGAPINRIRVTATVVGTGQQVGQEIMDVNSADPNWTVEIEVDIPNIPNPQIVLTVELINVSGGVESVEWSGETAPIELTATTTATNATVEVVRGPVENLSVTGVAIIAPENVRAGKSVALDATVSTSSSGGAPQLYWTSLTPEIGTVDENGVFTGLAAGTAQVKATAGAATDTKSIQVLPAIAKVVVEPYDVAIESLAEEVAFQAWVLDANDDPIDGETVTWTVDDESIMEPLGGGVFVSRANGVTEITATSDSEPTLSASARVDVHQLPDRVEVTPVADTLEAVGETTQYTAQAFDANDQPFPDPFFYWFTDNEDVATVDETGLVTAQGPGETNVNAEVILLLAAPSAGQGPAAVEGGTGVTGTAKVVVDLPLTLELTPQNGSIPAIGGTLQMVATATDGSGNKVTGLSYTWSSSDPGVATVDANGLVTAVKDGQTTITVNSGGISATAVVTVKQEVANIRWVQEPSDGELYHVITPYPSVEAVDANGHRVESYEGEISLQAQYVGCCLSPESQPASTQSGPLPNVDGDTVIRFVAGLAVFTNIYMIDSDGYYRLGATAAGFFVWSVVFYMLYGY